MEVYAEYLFLENFLMGVLILHLSGKIGNLTTNKKRIVVGGVLCGFFSFIILIQNTGMFFGTAIKIAFSLLLAQIVYKDAVIKGTLLIYVVSAFMGGMTIILLYMTKLRGITNNASLYIGDISYMNIVFGAVVSYFIIISFCKIMAAKQMKERIFTDITIEIEGNSVTHKALIDSGNFLKDPVSGKAVAIISKKAAEALRSISGIDFDKRFCLIPYSCIGVKKGLLEGYRTDRVYINGKAFNGVIVAVYDTEFCRSGEAAEYQVLLSKDFLTGGVA